MFFFPVVLFPPQYIKIPFWGRHLGGDRFEEGELHLIANYIKHFQSPFDEANSTTSLATPFPEQLARNGFIARGTRLLTDTENPQWELPGLRLTLFFRA